MLMSVLTMVSSGRNGPVRYCERGGAFATSPAPAASDFRPAGGPSGRKFRKNDPRNCWGLFSVADYGIVGAERWLRDFATWFDRIDGTRLPMPSDPTLLWTVFKKDFDKRAKSVFIAMSFREDRTLKDVGKAIKEAIQAFNSAHPNSKLSPCRVDEQKGASYDIPARVFQDIDQSSLLIADLSDEKPNVYCEVGYAKSRGIQFILTFHKREGKKPPWERNKVHFDLSPFRYLAYDNPLDLRDLLKAELDALFDQEQPA